MGKKKKKKKSKKLEINNRAITSSKKVKTRK